MGINKTPEYRAWGDMKQRCLKTTHPRFCYYGARGITVCECWKNSFANFLFDMGKRPSSQHSLDRIDNDGNYEPGNCRWATRKEQAINTRMVRLITWNGITDSLAGWAKRIGIDHGSLRRRIDVYPLEIALTLKPRENIIPGYRCQKTGRTPTGFKGVYRSGNRFQARIRFCGKLHYIGLFSTAKNAARAYNQAAVTAFGSFARLSLVSHHTNRADSMRTHSRRKIMLVLRRKPGEKIAIGEKIAVEILDVQGDLVRIGITAPKEILVLRSELINEATK